MDMSILKLENTSSFIVYLQCHKMKIMKKLCGNVNNYKIRQLTISQLRINYILSFKNSSIE